MTNFHFVNKNILKAKVKKSVILGKLIIPHYWQNSPKFVEIIFQWNSLNFSTSSIIYSKIIHFYHQFRTKKYKRNIRNLIYLDVLPSAKWNKKALWLTYNWKRRLLPQKFSRKLFPVSFLHENYVDEFLISIIIIS